MFENSVKHEKELQIISILPEDELQITDAQIKYEYIENTTITQGPNEYEKLQNIRVTLRYNDINMSEQKSQIINISNINKKIPIK
jgi:hypothetical protein